MTFFIWYRTM